MSHFFFLSSLLPELDLQVAPENSFDDLIFLYDENLSSYDKKLFHKMRAFTDLSNIARVLEGREIDSRGNLSEHELDEALLHQMFFCDELFRFLDSFEDKTSQVKHFSGIEMWFLKENAQKYSGFLSYYFRFEFELRSALASYRALQQGKSGVFDNLDKEVRGDDFITHLEAQTDLRSWQPLDLVSDLKEVLDKVGSDPVSEHTALTHYRFNKIQSGMEKSIFSMDYLLGYLALFMLVEDYQKLKKTQQHQWLDAVCEGIG